MKKCFLRFVILAHLFFFFTLPAFSIPLHPEQFPLIPKLSSRDPVFSQYCAEVEFSAKRQAQGKSVFPQFYAYIAKKNDTLFAVASLCAIPYETIATINRIEHIDDSLQDRLLILPTEAGLFVYENPISSTEILLQKKYELVIQNDENPKYELNSNTIHFLKGKRFSPTERAFFLDSVFRLPLEHAWLSSSYGMRKSPISGRWKFHEGIDLASPEGTPVLACKSGRVTKCVTGDAVYGNYVVIAHNNSLSSLYAHLSKISVSKGAIVKSGEQIGNVGKTGLATGTHLHFEIRENGRTTDPNKFLQK